jgi:hypothetical protein
MESCKLLFMLLGGEKCNILLEFLKLSNIEKINNYSFSML